MPGEHASIASASVDGWPLYLGSLSGFSLQAALEPYDGAKQQEAAGLALYPGWSLSSQPRVSNRLMSALTVETRTLSGGGKQIRPQWGRERATGLEANGEEIKVSAWVRKPCVTLPRPGPAFKN